jgi:dTDP-4-dehydrorhamnose 3,5-epimerase
MSELSLQALPLAGLYCLQQAVHADERGRFARLFCEGSLAAFGQPLHVRQINHSRTALRGTVRGLHFQHPPQAESKLICCLRGAVWDVAVDVRRSSPTFLYWHAERLEAGDGRSLLLPPGFAHGFQALSDDAELLYLHSADYAPDYEDGLLADDPRLAIDWPLPIAQRSARDCAHSELTGSFTGVDL